MAHESILKAVKESARKRTEAGVRYMDCPVCGKQMRKWVSQLKRAKLPLTCGRKCRAKGMSGVKSPSWRGGRWVAKATGYVNMRTTALSEEDLALLPTPKPREVMEHRLVIARLLGRWPKPHEHIHHKNGDKTDNRPANLVLMDWAQHSRDHRDVLRRLAILEGENKLLRAALASKKQ